MTQVISAFVGALGFALLFGVRHKYIWTIAINAGASWTLYLICCEWLNDFWGYLFASAFCSLFASVAARFAEVPAIVMQMPAAVPMIPGGSLYYTVYYAMMGNRMLFGDYFKETFRALFGMAIGFALVEAFLKEHGESLTHTVERIKKKMN